MAARRDNRPKAGSETSLQPGDWRHLLSVGGIVGAIVGVLVLGAVLEADDLPTGEAVPVVTRPAIPVEVVPPTRIPEPTPEPVARTMPAEPAPVAAPAQAKPVTPAPRPATGAGRRADDDSARIARAAGAWTLQWAVVCDAANAERWIERLDDPRFYVLPVRHDGRGCFRFCWGSFASRDAALAARADLPRELGSDAKPREIAEVLP